MSGPPDPIRIYHFTHVHNLPGIIDAGLRSDSTCRREHLTQVEVGSAGIRERRLTLAVNVGPGGVVGDYVPWYFGPRSPMMYTLSRNNHEYRAGFDDVVYLVSSLPTVTALGCRWVASDRNAALAVADFCDDEDTLRELVSWEVIDARYWTNYPDGADLRAAELLVHEVAPWPAIEMIGTKTARTTQRVTELLTKSDHQPPVAVRADWYF